MIMHDAQVYGQLILNNEPMSPHFVSKKIGISVKKYNYLLKELEFAGVINRKENGVIYSGRMERDERERQQNRDRQRNHYKKTHGEPNSEPNADITATSRQPNGKPNGASSSSSSTSNKKEEEREPPATPPPAPATPPEPDSGPPSDPRRSHPAIVAIHETTGIYPPKVIWDELIDQLGANIDPVRLKQCFIKWVARGFNKTNYDWALDWYVNNNIPKAGNQNYGTTSNGSKQNGKQHPNTTALSEWASLAQQVGQEAA